MQPSELERIMRLGCLRSLELRRLSASSVYVSCRVGAVEPLQRARYRIESNGDLLLSKTVTIFDCFPWILLRSFGLLYFVYAARLRDYQ
jgi:hypothetical protein